MKQIVLPPLFRPGDVPWGHPSRRRNFSRTTPERAGGGLPLTTGLIRRAALLAAISVIAALSPATSVTAQDSAPDEAPPPGREELVGRPTRSSKTYLNPDGTLTTTFFSGPVHFADDHGRWKEIEDELIATGGGPYASRNGRNAFDLAFGGPIVAGGCGPFGGLAGGVLGAIGGGMAAEEAAEWRSKSSIRRRRCASTRHLWNLSSHT